MSTTRWRNIVAGAAIAVLVPIVLSIAATPATAQNRKKAWEIFIYFGEYAGQSVPSAIQQGVVTTYRLDPFLGAPLDPNTGLPVTDPNFPVTASTPRFCTICRNVGRTGPGSVFEGPIVSGQPTRIQACPPIGSTRPIEAYDPNLPYLDECDDDIEARYVYNAKGIVTNGEVQRNSAEFLLGARLGYNVTRHWEAELDLGFAKQRLDMTRNLIPLLTDTVTNPADPWFSRLADFFVFTWANIDYPDIGYSPVFGTDPNIPTRIAGLGEIPNVVHHRFSKNAAADIPALLPTPFVSAERFEDVTDFVNRVFRDPTAFRNRANQINIDIFSLGLTGVYNFNTKPDSRIVPYVQGGFGRWMRSFDSPYEGEDTDYLTAGGGVRFFVNEIFSFRAEWRSVFFQDDTTVIEGVLPRQNLLDVGGLNTACMRDQDPPAQQPPAECTDAALNEFQTGQRARLPRNSGAGGNAKVSFITETDDFWEARVGFDILLGGK